MKVLIIGLGSIARKHIKVLRETGEVTLFALRSSNGSLNIDGVTNLYKLEEVEDFDFDFFLISNPTSEHASIIKKLIKFKKPFFIEKPVFNTVSIENQGLIDSLKRANIPTYTACNLRFLDCLQEIKKLIKDSRINEVNIYCGSYLPDWRPGVDFKKVYSANKEMGGGVHIDLIHELDYLYWIFGKPSHVKSTFRSNSALEITAIDYANYLWEYKSFSANLILNYYRTDSKRTFEILTSEVTYMVDLLDNKIFKNGLLVFTSDQRIADTYFPQMDFFIKTVLTNKNSYFNSAEEAYNILQLCIPD